MRGVIDPGPDVWRDAILPQHGLVSVCHGQYQLQGTSAQLGTQVEGLQVIREAGRQYVLRRKARPLLDIHALARVDHLRSSVRDNFLCKQVSDLLISGVLRGAAGSDRFPRNDDQTIRIPIEEKVESVILDAVIPLVINQIDRSDRRAYQDLNFQLALTGPFLP